MSAPTVLPLCCSLPPVPEILLGAGGVALPPAGRAHPEEPAAGGGEAAAGPRGQHHHGHPRGSGGVLRAHLQPAARAGGGRYVHTRLKLALHPDGVSLLLHLLLIIFDVDPASRRSGEPGVPSSVRQPLLRLQQLPQELLLPPGLRVVRPLVGQR